MGPIGDDGDDGDTTREHRHAFVDGDETGSKRLDDDDVREAFARRKASSRVFSRESEEKKNSSVSEEKNPRPAFPAGPTRRPPLFLPVRAVDELTARGDRHGKRRSRRVSGGSRVRLGRTSSRLDRRFDRLLGGLSLKKKKENDDGDDGDAPREIRKVKRNDVRASRPRRASLPAIRATRRGRSRSRTEVVLWRTRVAGAAAFLISVKGD